MRKTVLNKSVEISYSLFPAAYLSKKRYRTFHFAFGWKKNELLGIGQNYPDKPSGKALKFAKKFRANKIIRYPYLHAEIDLISRLWGKIHIDNNLTIVVLRINSDGNLKNSQPCSSCSIVLNALNIEDVWWSTEEGITNAKVLRRIGKP